MCWLPHPLKIGLFSLIFFDLQEDLPKVTDSQDLPSGRSGMASTPQAGKPPIAGCTDLNAKETKWKESSLRRRFLFDYVLTVLNYYIYILTPPWTTFWVFQEGESRDLNEQGVTMYICVFEKNTWNILKPIKTYQKPKQTQRSFDTFCSRRRRVQDLLPGLASVQASRARVDWWGRQHVLQNHWKPMCFGWMCGKHQVFFVLNFEFWEYLGKIDDEIRWVVYRQSCGSYVEILVELRCFMMMIHSCI